MPTKLYTKKAIGSVGHAGKTYDVVDGEVDVPDDAVATLCESHGFTEKPHEEVEADEPVDPDEMTLKQLIDFGNSKYDLGFTNRVSKADALEAVKAAIEKGK
jgi:hypothetical protein